MSKEAGGIEPLAASLLARRLKPWARRCAAAAGLRCSSELARSSDRRAGVRRESRCGVVGDRRRSVVRTTPLRLGTLGGLMNVSYIFILLESWFFGRLATGDT